MKTIRIGFVPAHREPFDEQWADSGETLAFIPWSNNKRLIPPAPLPIYTRQIGVPRANPSA